MWRRLLVVLLLPLVGVGCVPRFGATSLAAEDLSFSQGTTFDLQETSVSLPFVGKGLATYSVTLDVIAANELQLHWSSVKEQETAASQEAREAALAQMTEGAEVALPQAEIVSVEESGTLFTDALAEGSALYLPLDWDVGEERLVGDGTSVLFIPRSTYQALVDAGTAEIRLGLIDVLASDAAGMLQTFKDLLGTFADQPVSGDVVMGADAATFTVTSLNETFVLTVDGKRVKVPVLHAESPLASIVVLKNEQYPLVLSVTLEPWAAITDVSDISAFIGRLERGLAPPLGYKVEGIGSRE